jgi:hypothetical protein
MSQMRFDATMEALAESLCSTNLLSSGSILVGTHGTGDEAGA